MGWRIGCKETSRFRRRYLDEPRRMEIVRGWMEGLVFGCGEDSLTMLRIVGLAALMNKFFACYFMLRMG